ncbi:hypothetical protein [Bacillus toyonensis]|uniref:hypothetical protein n=1 Tax=Bacillus toyonensis TaxID=155322 RepID=UPI000BF9D431|nr:hypothetical protein [Bacillus toyonensis]PGF05093.1 hypothetical protein COM61_01300 [Bacillus toyonensis]
MFKSFNNKGFELNFTNGVSISVQWGYSNYCSVRDLDRKHDDSMQVSEHKSETAEIEIMHGKKNITGEFAEHYKLSADSHVIGWLQADVVANAITWAQNYKTMDLTEEVKETLLNYNKQDMALTRGILGDTSDQGYLETLGETTKRLYDEMNRENIEGRHNTSNVRFIGEIPRNDRSNLEEYEGDGLVVNDLDTEKYITRERKQIRTLNPTRYSTENPLELKYYYDYLTFPTHGRIMLGEYQYTDNPIAILDFELEENDSVGTLSLTDVNKQKRHEFQVNLDSDVRLIISKIEFIGYDLLVYLNVEGKEEDDKVVFPIDTMTIKRILTYVITD